MRPRTDSRRNALEGFETAWTESTYRGECLQRMGWEGKKCPTDSHTKSSIYISIPGPDIGDFVPWLEKCLYGNKKKRKLTDGELPREGLSRREKERDETAEKNETAHRALRLNQRQKKNVPHRNVRGQGITDTGLLGVFHNEASPAGGWSGGRAGRKSEVKTKRLILPRTLSDFPGIVGPRRNPSLNDQRRG